MKKKQNWRSYRPLPHTFRKRQTAKWSCKWCLMYFFCGRCTLCIVIIAPLRSLCQRLSQRQCFSVSVFLVAQCTVQQAKCAKKMCCDKGGLYTIQPRKLCVKPIKISYPLELSMASNKGAVLEASTSPNLAGHFFVAKSLLQKVASCQANLACQYIQQNFPNDNAQGASS